MEKGTYILVLSGPDSNYWGQQPHFESVLLENHSDTMQLLSVSDNNNETFFSDLSFPTPSKNIPRAILDILENLSILDQSGRKVSLIKSTLRCGERYKDIYRPIFLSEFRDIGNRNVKLGIPSEYYQDSPISNTTEYCNYIRQLEIILDELFEIFKVVEPHSSKKTKSNLETYGNRIRNVIILACTEVDALLKTILKGNNVKSEGNNYCMVDYLKLKEPMCLDCYTMSFRYIKDIGEWSPFKKWYSNSPEWYQSYNKVKHDRFKNIEKATLANAINAIMAFVIVLAARYGYRNDIWTEKIGKVLQVKKEPVWNIRDFYIPPIENQSMSFVPFTEFYPQKRIKQ